MCVLHVCYPTVPIMHTGISFITLCPVEPVWATIPLTLADFFFFFSLNLHFSNLLGENPKKKSGLPMLEGQSDIKIMQNNLVNSSIGLNKINEIEKKKKRQKNEYIN